MKKWELRETGMSPFFELVVALISNGTLAKGLAGLMMIVGLGLIFGLRGAGGMMLVLGAVWLASEVFIIWGDKDE